MEVTITGTREGFTETIAVNISLFRRFIRSSQLHVEELTIGTLSKTKAAILYISSYFVSHPLPSPKMSGIRLHRRQNQGTLPHRLPQLHLQNLLFSSS